MAVLNWTVCDVAPSGPLDDKHKTQWTAAFRGYVLTVLRTRGTFECWIQKVGEDRKISHTRNIRSLIDAQECVVDAAVPVLNGRVISDEEHGNLTASMLVQLAETHEAAAQHMADVGFYGEELSLKLRADRYRREAAQVRSTTRPCSVSPEDATMGSKQPST